MLSNLRAALTLEPSLFPELVADNIKSGQIQKFEVTVELLWKTVQVFLFEVDGVDVITPKSVAKEFVEAGYCDYEAYELFIRAINDRNQLSHIYLQEMAESIWQRLPEYVRLVEQIAGAMRSTEKLNNIYKAESSRLDPQLSNAQFASIGRDEWL